MKIGVTGATGQLGSIVIEKLKEKVAADSIVALVRSPQKVESLGVEARAFDYNEEQGLDEALKGIDRLLLISGSEVGQRKRQHTNVVEAAKKAGVQWIVYTSLLHADTSSLSLAPEHIATEQVLKSSGLSYTILRNGWYTENYANSIAGALQAGALVGSAEDGKIASATREDFAEAAAVVISDESHKGRVYELAGDEAYTLSELAAEISRQSGKEIPYNNVPEAEYAEILAKIGVPEGFAQVVASWDTSTAKGDLYDDGKQLSSLIGRPTTPMSQTVKEIVAQ